MASRYYEEMKAVLGDGGAAYCIIPIGDPAHENAAHTTVTTIGAGGGDGLVFTYQTVARTSFAQSTFYRGRGRIPFVKFGATEKAETPDSDFFSFGNGLSDSAVSLGIRHNSDLGIGSNRPLLAKDSGTVASSEWTVRPANPNTTLYMYDGSAGVTIGLRTSLVSNNGRFHGVIFTKNATGGATAMSAGNAEVYVDGTLDPAPTRTNNASYVAMENLALEPTVGCLSGGAASALAAICGGPTLFVVRAMLTKAQVMTIASIERTALQELIDYRRLRR